MDWALIASLIALGAATGFVVGLLGIGGGGIIVPVLTWIFATRGYPEQHIVRMAVATSLATILLLMLAGYVLYRGIKSA
jgi:uncharacterized membrane protein YfcA